MADLPSLADALQGKIRDMVLWGQDPNSSPTALEMATVAPHAPPGEVAAPDSNQYVSNPPSFVDDLRNFRDTALTSPAVSMATALMGAKTPDLGVLPSGAPRVENPIRLYQGGPHDIQPEPDYPMGRLRDDKLGSGEGGGAENYVGVYGRGHYGAEAESVAKEYRDALSEPKLFANGEPFISGDPLHEAGYAASKTPRVEALDYYNRMLSLMKDSPRKDYLSSVRDVLASDQPLPTITKGAGGHMYEWAVHADPNQFLDWDKPMSEQPHIEALMDKAGLQLPMSYRPGSEAYSILKGAKEDAVAASQALKEAGIPGIRYLDQGSRGYVPPTTDSPELQAIKSKMDAMHQAVEENNGDVHALRLTPEWKDLVAQQLKAQEPRYTSNYVIFDPRIVDIVRKYGMAGLLGSGLMGQMAAPGQNDGQ